MRYRVGDKVKQFHGMTSDATVVAVYQRKGMYEPEYTISFDDFPEVPEKKVRESEITDAPPHSPQYHEDYYQMHLRNESYDELHPDGCFWCGNSHLSDTCHEKDDSYFYES